MLGSCLDSRFPSVRSAWLRLNEGVVAPTFLASALALLASPAVESLGADSLVAQPVVFASQIEEGMEFRRTVRLNMRAETSRGTGAEVSRITAAIRVAELRDDGSGVLVVVFERAASRLEHPDGSIEEWASDYPEPAPEPAPDMVPRRVPDPGWAYLASAMGRPFEVPFLPGGAVDPAPFMEVPTTEAQTLDLWLLATLVSPRDRADGLPVGFPDALDPGDSHTVRMTSPDAMMLEGTYTLEGVSEREGRQVARVRVAWDGAQAMEEIGFPGPFDEDAEAELFGHLDFDLEAGRLVESVLTVRTARSMPDGGSVMHDFETRTERVGGAR